MMDSTMQNGRSNRGSFAGFQHSNSTAASMLQSYRQTTPDSDAMASSDDDHKMDKKTTAKPTFQPPVGYQPARRSSWLSEIQPSGVKQPTRKASIGTSPISPLLPQNALTTGDNPLRRIASSNIDGPITSSSRNPWQDNLLPASTAPLGRTSYSANYNPWPLWPQASPTVNGTVAQQLANKANMDEGNIPFPIPLEPVRKSVRSSSYSVGQLDGEGDAGTQTGFGIPVNSGRAKAGLYHRPSRPSLLSESSRDFLGQVLEDEISESDNDNNGVKLPPSTTNMAADNVGHGAKTLLKQATFENARARQRGATTSHSLGSNLHRALSTYNSALSDEDFAIDEMDDSQQQQNCKMIPNIENDNTLQTTTSDIDLRHPQDRSLDFKDNRDLAIEDSPRRMKWQTDFGFGCLAEPPQSRRHSFADMPSRSQPALTSMLDPHYPLSPPELTINRRSINASTGDTDQPEGQSESDLFRQIHSVDEEERMKKKIEVNDSFAQAYFSGTLPASRHFERVHENSRMLNASGSATNNPFAVPTVIHRSGRQLFIVSFKCCRADIYYLPEGVGLEVQVGHVVVVEGDRGHDMGSVLHARITPNEARNWKDTYDEMHYEWITMFSPNKKINPDGRTGHLSGDTSRLPEAQPQHDYHSRPLAGELDVRPKLIKRIATPYEVSQLMEKEGSEAKAKRLCQHKANERGLKMEILEAELQMDLHKLTFYYYADAYVNFNDLVTDLFKIYKTRIWMSAVNPASFANKASIGQHRPAIAPGAVQHAGPSALGFAAAPSTGFGGNGFGQSNLTRQHHTYAEEARARSRHGNVQGFSQNNVGSLQNQEVREALARVDATEPALQGFEQPQQAQSSYHALSAYAHNSQTGAWAPHVPPTTYSSQRAPGPPAYAAGTPSYGLSDHNATSYGHNHQYHAYSSPYTGFGGAPAGYMAHGGFGGASQPYPAAPAQWGNMNPHNAFTGFHANAPTFTPGEPSTKIGKQPAKDDGSWVNRFQNIKMGA